MKSRQVVGLGLLVAGVAGLYFGIQSTDSPMEQLNEVVTGRYTDDTMLHLIGGGAAAVVGLALLIFGKK